MEPYNYRVFTVPGHIRIVNDPVELVPLLMTFNDPSFKKVYELLNKSWLTEDEISDRSIMIVFRCVSRS